MVLRIYGDLVVDENGFGPLEHRAELFDDWDSYQRFVMPIVQAHDMVRDKNSPIL